MKTSKTSTPLLLLTATLLLLILSLSFPLHAETSKSPASKPPPQNQPFIWDGLSDDNPSATVVITGGRIRIENNTLVMEDLTIVTPPMIYRNIRPPGAKDAPGFGTIYKTSGKRTISGRITIKPLP